MQLSLQGQKKNKDQLLFQEHADNNIDTGLITETWLKNTQEDEA